MSVLHSVLGETLKVMLGETLKALYMTNGQCEA